MCFDLLKQPPPPPSPVLKIVMFTSFNRGKQFETKVVDSCVDQLTEFFSLHWVIVVSGAGMDIQFNLNIKTLPYL